MSIDHATSLTRLDRQIKDLGEWLYSTKSVPGYVKAQLAEIQATLRDLWEEIEPSAFGEGRHCGTPGLIAAAGQRAGPMTEKQIISRAMSLLSAIPSKARAEASRINGRKGGRPRGNKKQGGKRDA